MTGSSKKKGLQGRVQSIEVGARLLKVMAKLEGPQMLKDIAHAAKMPPAKVHRYLASLIREGIIEQSDADDRYDFGGSAREIGQAAMGRLDIVRIGTAVLLDLHKQLHETVLLGVWGNAGPTVIYSITAARPVSVNVRVGAVFPTLTSAIGKICAAYLPRSLTETSIERDRAANKRAGLPVEFWQQQPMERMFAQIRKEGFTLVKGEMMVGIHAIGVPILNKHEELIAVISCAGAAGSLDMQPKGPLLRHLKEAAARFGAGLGQDHRR
jgi:DNA-binding IclR family transcriptional regulator